MINGMGRIEGENKRCNQRDKVQESGVFAIWPFAQVEKRAHDNESDNNRSGNIIPAKSTWLTLSSN